MGSGKVNEQVNVTAYNTANCEYKKINENSTEKIDNEIDMRVFINRMGRVNHT